MQRVSRLYAMIESCSCSYNYIFHHLFFLSTRDVITLAEPTRLKRTEVYVQGIRTRVKSYTSLETTRPTVPGCKTPAFSRKKD